MITYPPDNVFITAEPEVRMPTEEDIQKARDAILASTKVDPNKANEDAVLGKKNETGNKDGSEF